MAVAMEWVAQITTVVAEMVLPGVAGQWVDKHWGTKFIALVGFGLGLTVAIWHLLAMTRPRPGGQSSSPPESDGGTDGEMLPRSDTESEKKQD
jgi:hypothetical protein